MEFEFIFRDFLLVGLHKGLLNINCVFFLYITACMFYKTDQSVQCSGREAIKIQAVRALNAALATSLTYYELTLKRNASQKVKKKHLMRFLLEITRTRNCALVIKKHTHKS